LSRRRGPKPATEPRKVTGNGTNGNREMCEICAKSGRRETRPMATVNPVNFTSRRGVDGEPMAALNFAELYLPLPSRGRSISDRTAGPDRDEGTSDQ
jgi:hypothetical protein